MKRKYLCILLIGLICFNGFCQKEETEEELMLKISEYEKKVEKNPDDSEVLTTLGLCYHNVSSKYDKKMGKEAVKYLRMAYKLNPTTENKSWLGSALTIMARDSESIIDKITTVQEGISLIDGAIEDDPENLTARIVRVGNSINMPEDFQRLDKVNKDFKFLFKKIKSDPDAFEGLYDPGIVFLHKAKYLVNQNKFSLAYKFAENGLKIVRSEDTKQKILEFMEDLEEF